MDSYWVQFQADNAQLVRSTGANMSVIVLQGCKSSPQKSRPLEFGHRKHAVWIAIEHNYKLRQQMNLLVQTRLVFAETVTFMTAIYLTTESYRVFS